MSRAEKSILPNLKLINLLVVILTLLLMTAVFFSYKSNLEEIDSKISRERNTDNIVLE